MSVHLSRFGETPKGTGRTLVALVLLIVLTTVVRFAAASELHLTEDEAYYRLWSMAPAFGYYDHPPMVSWWVWLGRWVAGDSALGVRLLPIIAAPVTTFLVFDITRILGGADRDGLRSALWYNGMLLVSAGAILAVPDSPAALFWTSTVWFVLMGISRGWIGWWVGAGIAAGLASLSKYSALFLAPGVLAWLLLRPDNRKILASPAPWVAALIATAMFSINVEWNGEHHWLTFAKQFGRIAPTHFSPNHLTIFLATQLALINPLIALFFIRGVRSGKIRREVEALTIVGAPFACYLLLHSLHDSVQAHWPAPLYPSMAVCAALAARVPADRVAWRVLRGVAPLPGLAVYPLVVIALSIPYTNWLRVASPILGWPQFAQQIEQDRVFRGAAWVGVLSYGLAAELYDEPSIHAPILQLTERDRYHDLRLPQPDLVRPGLVLDLARRVDESMLRNCFERVQFLKTLRRVNPTPPAKAYAVFLVAGPRHQILRDGCPA